jgi:Flp pilus assembly protein TadG
LTDERGVAAAIVLFPIFAAVVFMFVNGAMWQLDRQVATAAADRASQAVALHGSSVGAARGVAVEQLRAAGIEDISVDISRGAEFTTVSVSGRSPGMLSGLTVTVSATSVTPTERITTP